MAQRKSEFYKGLTRGGTVRSIIRKIRRWVLDRVQSPEKVKERHALYHWIERKAIEGDLHNKHFKQFYTDHFGLDGSFYAGKKIMDIGCGPRGSLEWANMAAECVGLDPFAKAYLKLGADKHNMMYVPAYAENMPFPNGHFDIVSSFNSFDHVDDLGKTISEIVRVVAPGGTFLLITDIRTYSTICEPQVFSWDIVDKFKPYFDIGEIRHYEYTENGIYESVLAGVIYDHYNTANRKGVLSARFTKKLDGVR